MNAISKNWYNKIGVYKVEECHDLNIKQYVIRLRSHDSEESEITNYLSIGFRYSYKVFKLPFALIKPLFDYNTYETDKDSKLSHSEQIEKQLPIKYPNYVENEWTFSVLEDYVRLAIKEGDFLYNDNNIKPLVSIFWSIPWKTRIRTKDLLLNLDGSTYFDRNIGDLFFEKNKECDWDLLYEKQNAQEAVSFYFLDYDKEENVVTCKREYSEYSLGSNKYWRALFRLFGSKPVTYNNLELSFQRGIGRGKGSWKGGTTSHSIRMLDRETPEDAFKRYCITPKARNDKNNETNMTFIKQLNDTGT